MESDTSLTLENQHSRDPPLPVGINLMDCTEHITNRRVLFKGGSDWEGNWTTTHSRVIRGIAYAHLDQYPHVGETQFHGWLDRKSVDTSAFAAMHTMGNENRWDLYDYDAIEIELSVACSDEWTYTIGLEDERPIRWEGGFRATAPSESNASEEMLRKVIRFKRLETLRGDAEDLRPLDMRNIRGVGILIRGQNGEHEGPFSLSIKAISVVKLPCSCPPTPESEESPLPRKGATTKVKTVCESVHNALTKAAVLLKPQKPAPQDPSKQLIL